MPHISDYSFGSVTVDGIVYNRDLIVLPGEVVGWRREQGHYLQPRDLELAVAVLPRLLIVGTGASGAMKVAPGTVEFLRARGIRFQALRTADAVEAYNRAPVGTVCALHLTC